MTTLDNMVDELESSINEDTGKHVIRQLFDKLDKKNIPAKTELNDNELKLITRLKVIGTVCDIEILHTICDEFMKHRISLNRQGRKELIEMGKQIGDNKFGARQFSFLGGGSQAAAPGGGWHL